MFQLKVHTLDLASKGIREVLVKVSIIIIMYVEYGKPFEKFWTNKSFTLVVDILLKDLPQFRRRKVSLTSVIDIFWPAADFENNFHIVGGASASYTPMQIIL